MNGDIDSAEQGRNDGLGGLKLRRCTRYIKLGGQSRFRPGASQVKSVLLSFDIFVCNLKPALETPQLGIGTPDIAQEDHLNIAPVFLSGHDVCCGRLHAPAGSSKDIPFPRGGNAALKVIEFDWSDNGRTLRSDWRNDPLAIASPRGRPVDGREITRPSEAACCTGFLYAFESQLEVQVSTYGPLDE
jgi:hypothetical protein